MPSCCVVSCTKRSTNNPGLKFYNIPAGSHPFHKNRRDLWLRAIKRDKWSEAEIKNARICGSHFISGKASMDFDSPDFVPSIFPDKRRENSSSNTKKKMERYDRKRKRDANKSHHTPKNAKRKLDVETIPNITNSEEPSVEQPSRTGAPEFIPKAQFDEMKLLYDRLHTDHTNLTQDFLALRKENEELKKKLGMLTFGYNSVTVDNERLKFFTGLTSLTVFVWLVNILKRNILLVSQKMSVEDHLLLVLIKLRLGISNRDIAYRFQIPVSTVSRTLRTCLPVLSAVLKPLIKWPSKEAVQENMPVAFKRKFCKCRCVIDCMEICIDRPTHLTARAQTWSSYKHNHTVKYLVGVTPAGAISFLSPGWGGSVSDKQITVESGFLDLVEEGDEVLADRGFLFGDELAAHGATLKIPFFTKGVKQMSAQDDDSSRQLSRVCFHVEKVIGRWKRFRILQSIIPISQADLLDDIVIVCGGLTNLCPGVI
ncbi:uncharacterized protein LOC114463999 isoform X2 [Gouania willdenowi]|uniref:uncharacterized protein LOC114463999 isoform X2 n=1 Tax=Gouania willdenowi TaxID=441366 RepID=UPI0010551C12|nr:uncharacterized protein LOC114463999 isoform X2 [Gouania willdenowi]